RDGAHGRVWKDEADGAELAELQFGDDGGEVVAVGAKAMQPDDGVAGIGACLELEALEEVVYGVVHESILDTGPLLVMGERALMDAAHPHRSVFRHGGLPILASICVAGAGSC